MIGRIALALIVMSGCGLSFCLRADDAKDKNEGKAHSAVSSIVKGPVTEHFSPGAPKVKTPRQGTPERAFKDYFSTKNSIPFLILMAFVAGILVSFTPCVYPMIPITAGILGTANAGPWWDHAARSISYVLGIAIVYASLGYVSATTNVMFGQWMASPWVVGLLVLLFLYLAFSMLGFYDIPGFEIGNTSKSAKWAAGRSPLALFVVGMVSGLAASPCLTPPLALLLGLVARIGNPIIGFVLLFSFALGMGSILLAIGLFSGALLKLPKPGQWMEDVKKVFGFAMLYSCMYFIMPFLQEYQIYVGYGLLSGSVALYYFFSSRYDVVHSVVASYKKEGGQAPANRMSFYSIGHFFKMIAAVALMLLSMYCFANSYLSYQGLTLKRYFKHSALWVMNKRKRIGN